MRFVSQVAGVLRRPELRTPGRCPGDARRRTSAPLLRRAGGLVALAALLLPLAAIPLAGPGSAQEGRRRRSSSTRASSSTTDPSPVPPRGTERHTFGRDAWDLRYKIKPGDGNLWAGRYGHGHPVRGDAEGRELLLTYDDGPFPTTTPRLLDLLDELHLKAVFFVLGHRIAGNSPTSRRNREILLDAWRRGHVIGSHGYTHHTMPAMPIDQQESEIERTERLIADVIGERPWLYRPPGGRLDDAGRRMIMAHGYTIAWWRYDSLDWQRGEPEAIAGRVIHRLEGPHPRGGIVLFHDTVGQTHDATRLLVDWVRRRNRQLREAGQAPFEFTGFESFYEPLRRPPSPRVRRAMPAGPARGRADGGAAGAAGDAGVARPDAGS